MANKKQVTKASNKIVYIFFGVGLLILLLVGFLYYQSQRPNYRDLEKAFNELTIPEGWQEVSSSSNKGTWGLFCWQIEGEECPYKTVVYKREAILDYDELQNKIKQSITMLEKLGYTVKKAENIYCDQIQFNNSEYLCEVSAEKNGKEATVTYRSSDAMQNKGDFVSVSISSSE
jgi:hypothetical protein